MARLPSFERRLLQVLACIAAVATLGVLVILTYRLYDRDIRHAQVQAHRISSVVQTAIGSALRDGRDVTDLVNRLQSIGDLDIRLVETAPDKASEDRAASSVLDGTDLTYTSSPVRDPDGRTWLAHLEFDLTPMKRESVRLIIDLVVSVVLASAAFSAAVFYLVHHSILAPLRNLTETVSRLHPSGEPVALPESQSREMAELVDAVARACEAHRTSD